ncbi:hypothetical protein CAEBREN_05986 [Caenorhabditis brenneri]|uniref:F-box domain-containing protein n=1 Tax=Caenorhabditis brenneri TaxID=135651 RepID=G0MQI4_CAEBE|nr:hypothetical protein CAEBREN_05986 [Caenorhabditis brenneri]
MPLRFFRIPFLAIKIILNQMESCEIFMLSQTSSKARRITKFYEMGVALIVKGDSDHFMFLKTSKKLSLVNSIHLSDRPRQYSKSVVFDQNKKIPCDIEFENSPDWMRGDFVHIYVNCLDRMDIRKSVIKYFVDSFTVTIKSMLLTSNNIGDRYQILEYTKRPGLNFQKINWCGTCADDPSFADVFDGLTADFFAFRLTRKTDMFCHTRFQNARINKLFLKGGQLNPTLNLTDFLNCGSVHISYHRESDGKVSDEKLNAFIKAWLNSNSPLTLLQIEMRAPNWKQVIKQVEGVQKDGRVYKLFKDGVEAAHILFRNKCFFFVEKKLRDSSDESDLFLGSVQAKCSIADRIADRSR